MGRDGTNLISNAGQRDRIDARVRQQRGARWGATCVCILLLLLCSSSSTLLLCFSPSSSFPVIYLLQKAGRTQSRSGRDRTDAGHDSNVGQDKGVAEWEEEVEGRLEA